MTAKHILFLVGQILYDEPWEFQGIFDSEELASNACRDANYFYVRVVLNEELLHETGTMEDVHFPVRGIVVGKDGGE